jgi:cold-inducible RNA-binding protein
MAKKLFVGSLDWNTTEEELKAFFAELGEVEEAIIIKDHLGRSKGFGFVTYVDDESADKAVADLDGKELGQRTIVVNEARPKEES